MTAKQPFLTAFEQHLQRGPTDASRLIGIAYVTYSQWHNGRRPLPEIIQRHIEALMMLDQPTLDSLVEKYVDGR